MTDIKTLWTSQKTEDSVTLKTIHDTAARFQRRARLGNAIEYGASALAVAIFALYVVVLPGWMMKLGSGLVLLGVLYGMWQFFRRGRTDKVPDGSALDLVQFHRSALTRRRDLLRSYWTWFLLPTLPGTVLMILGRWVQSHASWRSLAWDHEVIVMAGAVVVAIIGSILIAQRWIARTLQRQIDELDGLRGDSDHSEDRT
jgi:hypothetical protein